MGVNSHVFFTFAVLLNNTKYNSMKEVILQKFQEEILLNFTDAGNPFAMYKSSESALFKHAFTNDYAFCRTKKDAKTGKPVFVLELFKSDCKELKDIESDYLKNSVSFKFTDLQQVLTVINFLA